MTSLHRRIIALLTWLGLFFNVERLHLMGTEKIDLSAWIYIVGTVVAILPLLSLGTLRSLPALIGTTALLYGVALVANQEPVVGGIHTYLTLVSFFFIGGTLLLSYWVKQATQEFTAAVETITFSDVGGRLRNVSEARDLVDIELIRSRRTEHPLTLMMFQADASSLDATTHRVVQEVQRSMIQRYVLAAVTKVLARTLRRTDVILEDGKPGRLMLLIPETSDQQAQQLSRRIATLVSDRLGIRGAFGIASFPQQALTFDDLVSVAEQQLNQSLDTANGAALDVELLELNSPRTMEPLPARK